MTHNTLNTKYKTVTGVTDAIHFILKPSGFTTVTLYSTTHLV